MKLLLIYSDSNFLNYNKLLIIKSFFKNKELFETNNIYIEEYIIDNPDDFIKNINLEKYKNYIFWLHQKIGSYILTFPTQYELIKKYNIKTIFWMDDLHFPTDNKNNIDRLDLNLIDNEIRYLNCDLILSPSIDYFYNIKSKLINKSKFIYYFFDENIINDYNPSNYDDRKSKILLSGKINSLSYESRKQMYTNYFYNKELYDYLEHPGYNKFKHNIYHINYYNKLSEYKGAILGLAKYPINFILAKVIEILGSGCLGFFEESDLYENRLNLIKNVHYISIDKDENELIFKNDYFKEILNSNEGKQIALNGYNFIKNNYNSIIFSEEIIKYLNILYNI